MPGLQLKFETIVHKMAFIKADLKYHKHEHQKRREIFFKDLHDYIRIRDLEFSEEKTKKNLIDVYERKEMLPVPALEKQNKKIFKQIASLTHPDKGATKEKIEVFLEAKEAAKAGDWFTLYQLGIDLKIAIPGVTIEQIKWMEQEIKKLEIMITKIVSTIEWLYCIEGANKDHLLTSYCMATCKTENE
jgi:hypothetical protein